MRTLKVNERVEWGPVIRPTRATIDLQAVVANSRRLAECAHSPVLAVVKADAYGHGAVEVAGALEHDGVAAGFAVSLVEEGMELRAAGIRSTILVMGPSLMDAHAAIVEHRLTPMLSDDRHIGALANAAKEAGIVLDLHLKIDSGMSRLGLRPAQLPEMLARLATMSSLRLTGIASHLACADEDDPEDPGCATHKQLALFADLVSDCRKTLGSHVQYHVANSAGLLRFARARYDLARPGIALYGNGAGPEAQLVQAMSLASEITQLRQVPKGERVSYGGHWTAPRDSLLAIVPIGYADGLPRNISGKGCALIGQERRSIVGNVSMDMIVVDVTDAHQPHIGQEVVLLGAQGEQILTVAELAGQAGISEYEITCGISKRVPRTYINEVAQRDVAAMSKASTAQERSRV